MDEVALSLNYRKTAFLNGVQEQVRRYIISTGKNCIAVVEKSPCGDILRTWECHLDDDLGSFCKVLYRFVRRQKHNGHELDSALTIPISNLVETAYQDFYQSESDAISSGMLHALASNEVKLVSFIDCVTDISLQKFSSQVKKQVMHLVVHQIKESIQQGTLHSVGNHIGHLAATTAGTQVAVIAAHLLIRLLATHITQIVAKLLASAFIKKLLAILIKKIVITAVASAVLQFLAVHFGAAIGGSTVMWVVMPLLVAYIGYKVATFPEKLGDEVSKSVRKELEARFESINKSILEQIFETVLGSSELVQAVSQDPEFQAMLQKLGRKCQDEQY